MDLSKYIRTVNDFPKNGVVYRDITPLLLEPAAMRFALNKFIQNLPTLKIDKVVGVEARGFFFAPLLAERLNAGLVPIRKVGKLPSKTARIGYDLEYGNDEIEVHCDAIREGEKVLVHDDVLATGGTALTACRLVEQLGGEIVKCNFLIELEDLKGREKLQDYTVDALFSF